MEDLKKAIADLDATVKAHSFYGVQGTYVSELKAKVAAVIAEVEKLHPEIKDDEPA